MPRIHPHIIDVLRLMQDLAPGLAGIGGKEYTAARVHIPALLAPRCQVHAAVVPRIERQAVGTITAGRKSYLLPVFGAVAGGVQGAAPRFTGLAFVIAGQDEVECSVVGSGQSPGEWLGF